MAFGEKPLNESVEDPRVVGQRLRAAIAQAEDKPAATGSGEPTTGFTKGYRNRHGKPVSDACGDNRHEDCKHDLTQCFCTYRGLHKVTHAYATVDQLTAAPTPPASQPTVTLDRETFDNVVSKLKIVERCTPDREGKDLVLDALALLRAAEQK